MSELIIFAEIKRCRRCNLPLDVHPILSDYIGQRWMLVGQAPGTKEVIENQLFIGPAGRRLFRWLNDAGFEERAFRKLCYITAVMKCFPGKGKRGDLRPSPIQIAHCGLWLEKEIDLVQPKVLIPVGKLAIERFLGNVRLEDVVGREFHREINHRKVLIIPLPHPSGASVWANRKENQGKIKRAVHLLKRLWNFNLTE